MNNFTKKILYDNQINIIFDVSSEPTNGYKNERTIMDIFFLLW